MSLARLLSLSAAVSLGALSLVACKDKGGDDDDPADDTAAGETDADGDGFDSDVDCDDDDPAVNPDATEICDGIDNDCDEAIDDADDDVDLSSGGTFYADADGDGHGAPDQTVQACAAPAGTADVGDDCDDGDAAISPSATEICDDADVDEDCSGDADDADSGVDTSTQTLWYTDADTDGYGDSSDTGTLYCDAPSGVVTDNTDCDDADIDVNPAATEVCDDADVDEDCSGDADDADAGVDTSTQTTFFADADSDGYGDDSDPGTLYCDPPSGVVTDHTDCDDTANGVNPAATEVCDDADVDEDCSGAADDTDSGVDTSTQTLWYTDADTDGYGDSSDTGTLYCDAPSGVVTDNTDCDDADIDVNPAATEVCNGVDDDCDTSTSESGMVSWVDSAGTLSDVTSSFSGGTSTSPVAYTASSDGELLFCDDTFYTNITVEADVGIAGVTGTEVLDGGATGSVVTIATDALAVSIDDITLQNGDSDNIWLGVYSAGGGVYCDGTSTLSMSSVELRENSAELGGGLLTSGCDVTITDSTFDTNESSFGGGVLAYDATVTLTDSTVTGNTASGSGGGLYAYDSSIISLDDTVLEDNEAEYGGGTAIEGGAVDCTSTPTTDGGFFANTATSWGGAFAFVGASTTATFDATSCDFGVLGSTDDNDAPEIYIQVYDLAYQADDDATFSCTSDRCGTATTYTIGDTTGVTPGNYYIKGNIFLADTDATVESYFPYLGGDSSCVVDHYVLSNSSVTTTGWTIEWSDTGNTVAPTAAFQAPDEVGIIVESGTYYAFVTGFRCSTSGHTVDYFFGVSSADDDVGFGDRVGFVNTPSYTSTLSGTVTLSTIYTTLTARYHAQFDVVDL